MKQTVQLPQPKIFSELRAMRQKVLNRVQKMGWEDFLADINHRIGHLLGKPIAPAPQKLGRKPSTLGGVRSTERRVAKRRTFDPAI